MVTKKLVRALLATLVVAASCMAWDLGRADEASAYEPGPLGPVPLTWAGGGAAGAAAGTMAMLPTTGSVGAGTAFVAFPATTATAGVAAFGAGLAVGYYGSSLACKGATGVADWMLMELPDLVEGACGSYEFVGPEAPEGVAVSPFGTCPGSIGTAPLRCQTVSWDALPDYMQGSTRFGLISVGPGSNSPNDMLGMGGCYEGWFNGGPIPRSTGSFGAVHTTCTAGIHNAVAMSAPYTGGWTTVTRYDPDGCATIPGLRNCGVQPGMMWFLARVAGTSYPLTADMRYMYAGGLAVDPVVDARGYDMRLRFVADCWTAPSTIVTRTNYGDWEFAAESPILPPNPCLDGETTKRIEIDWQWNNGLTIAAPTPQVGADIFTWTAPPEWTNPAWPHGDKVKRRTDVDTIPKLEVNEEDQCEWGGDVLLMSYCTETPVPYPVPEGELYSGPTPTTTVPPSTVAPPTTLAPPTDPENCVGAHCVGGPGLAPDGSEGGECFPSGWGWLNPVEWVLKPVKCALVWAFWDPDAADEMGDLMSDTGWPEAVSESSFTTDPAAGPCIDMDVAEICSSEVLEVEAPTWVSALVAAVVLFFGLFEVVGLFARITGG